MPPVDFPCCCPARTRTRQTRCIAQCGGGGLFSVLRVKRQAGGILAIAFCPVCLFPCCIPLPESTHPGCVSTAKQSIGETEARRRERLYPAAELEYNPMSLGSSLQAVASSQPYRRPSSISCFPRAGQAPGPGLTPRSPCQPAFPIQGAGDKLLISPRTYGSPTPLSTFLGQNSHPTARSAENRKLNLG